MDDPNGWHNIFFKDVVARIDEGLFEVLYNEGHGEDLMKAAFKQITVEQIEQYKVSGKQFSV